MCCNFPGGPRLSLGHRLSSPPFPDSNRAGPWEETGNDVDTNSGRCIQRWTPESEIHIQLLSREPGSPIPPASLGGDFASEWKMLETQAPDKEARQARLFYWKQIPSLPPTPLPKKAVIFFQMELASVTEHYFFTLVNLSVMSLFLFQ